MVATKKRRKRRCPGCARLVWASGGTIERHPLPRWLRKSGDYSCGAAGLRLASENPVRWERP